MSDEATIEDEAEVEADQEMGSSRPQTNTGLLKWSYIIEYATKQWILFLVFSIAIGVFLYVSARKRRRTEKAIGRDHLQGGSKGNTRKSPKRD